MSDQIYGKVSSDMDPFKKILSKIPGFGGYMERQARRDSDKLLRETVADLFEQQIGYGGRLVVIRVCLMR
jgi:hypothetical protein